MAIIYGNKAASYWQTYVDYSAWEDDNNFYISATMGVYWCKQHNHAASSDRPVYLTCNGATYNFYPTWEHDYKAGKSCAIGSASWTIPKTTQDQYVVLTGYNARAGGSTASVGFNIGKRAYDVTFNANGGEGSVATQKKRHDEALTLTSSKPTKTGYDFVGWNTSADGRGTSYASGGTLPANVNQDTVLYAQWHISYAPPVIANLRAYRTTNGASGVNPDVKSDGTRCYADFEYTPSVDPDAVTNRIVISFGTYNVNASTASARRYGYSGTNHLAVIDSETVTVTITVTDYLGNVYTYHYATYISTENYIWDAFKETRNSEEYGSFAVGGKARDFSNSDRSSKGNFDIYMDVSIVLNDGVQIVDSGTKITVIKTGSAETDDYLLAKAIADTFDYQTAKEILEV